MGRSKMADNVAEGIENIKLEGDKNLKGLKKKHDKKKAAQSGAAGSKKVAELKPPPEFIASRLAMWDRLKVEREAWLAAQTPVDITVTLPDGKTVPAQSWRTTLSLSLLSSMTRKGRLCFGTAQRTCWGRPWRGCMVGISAMVLLLSRGSIMTCIAMITVSRMMITRCWTTW